MHLKRQDSFMTRFGVDVNMELQAWFATIFMEKLREKYGDDAMLAVIVLNHHGETMHELITHSDENVIGPMGLLDNVSHKLNFVKRTGLQSSEAANRADLI